MIYYICFSIALANFLIISAYQMKDSQFGFIVQPIEKYFNKVTDLIIQEIIIITQPIMCLFCSLILTQKNVGL